jgi:hypothetical protein
MSDLPAGTRPSYQSEVVVRAPAERVRTLEALDLVSLVMDRCFTLPGARLRFGLSSVLLLLPGLGDALTSLIGFFILAIGLSHYRVPRIVATRMVLNSLLDTTLGAIPVVGPLFDVWFKADTRNVRLLRQYAGQGLGAPPSTWRHWAFVVGVLLLFVGVVALLVVGLVAVVRVMLRPAA